MALSAQLSHRAWQPVEEATEHGDDGAPPSRIQAISWTSDRAHLCVRRFFNGLLECVTSRAEFSKVAEIEGGDGIGSVFCSQRGEVGIGELHAAVPGET